MYGIEAKVGCKKNVQSTEKLFGARKLCTGFCNSQCDKVDFWGFDPAVSRGIQFSRGRQDDSRGNQHGKLYRNPNHRNYGHTG